MGGRGNQQTPSCKEIAPHLSPVLTLLHRTFCCFFLLLSKDQFIGSFWVFLKKVEAYLCHHLSHPSPKGQEIGVQAGTFFLFWNLELLVSKFTSPSLTLVALFSSVDCWRTPKMFWNGVKPDLEEFPHTDPSQSLLGIRVPWHLASSRVPLSPEIPDFL